MAAIALAYVSSSSRPSAKALNRNIVASCMALSNTINNDNGSNVWPRNISIESHQRVSSGIWQIISKASVWLSSV